MVAHSTVIARGDGPQMQLIAYVVLKPHAAVGADELRDHLAARLPDYMLPSSFVGMASLPVSTNGKWDRSALPAPTQASMLANAQGREPASLIETRVASLVAELLKLEHVGAEDNFFLLGGHSLLGTQLVLRAREAFAIELTLRDLFQAQTVAKLAARIEERILERLEQMSDEEARQLLAG